MTDSTTYKKTNIPWLPEVPKHWQLLRLKNFCDYVNRGNTPDYVESSSLKVVNQATFSKGFWDEQNIRFTSESEKDFRGRLVLNDVLLASTGGGVLGKTCIFAQFEGEYIADSHVTVLRDSLNRFDHRFLYYYLSINYNLINAVLAQGSTNQTELQREWLRGMHFPYPPIFEQIAISNYLDTQSEKINRFIAAKLRFIELLKEQRQGIIEKAITKGINPSTKSKFSGIDWLGYIPENWKVTRCKNVFKEIDFRSQDGTEELLSVSHYDGVKKRSEKDVMMFMAEDYTGYKLCWPDDLVINIMWAWMGAMGISKEHGIVSSAYGVYRLKNPDCYDVQFLDYLFRLPLMIVEYSKRSKGVHSSRARMYSDEFFQIEIITPPLEEQQQIVAYIQTETATIDAAIAKAEREIELIREYREAMIAEAITGKRKITDSFEEKLEMVDTTSKEDVN